MLKLKNPKTKKLILLWVFVWMCLFFMTQNLSYGGTKVGNGDDGSDLEGAKLLEKGPILEARKKTVERLEKLNTAGIEGLGNLLPEVQKSTLYLVTEDIQTSLPEEQNHFHTNMTGQVYARTMPELHAATRFFPVAEKLEEKQLVALHLHEGLHRSLPASIRENEAIVSKLTLAMANPEATHDSVASLTNEVMPKERPIQTSSEPPKNYFSGSNVGYLYRQFQRPTRATNYEVYRTHALQSYLYPFGSRKTRFGMGIDFSLVEGQRGSTSGPLGLSLNFKVLDIQGFEFSLWAQGSLNTLSAEELKDSPYGRDVGSLGVSIKKNLPNGYFENYVGLTFGGNSTQQISQVKYKYEYGSVINVKVRGGFKVWRFTAGGFGEIHLSDYFKVSGGAYPGYDTGRYQLLSAGPEISFQTEDVAISIFSRFLLSSTKNANFDFLGDVMGPGVSQGSIGGSAKFIF